MTALISTPPWDLAAGNRWTIQSEDHRIANDRGNEVIVDANGSVVAYVAGGMENGNGALLAAAPALRDALKACLASFELAHCHKKLAKAGDGGIVCACDLARAALKQAGQS